MGDELDANNFEQMIISANKMAELGKNANEYIIKSFKILNEMKTIWYGKAYDKTINGVNNYIDELNENMRFLTKLGPLELVNKVKAHLNYGLNTLNEIDDIILLKIDKPTKSYKAPKFRFLSSKIEMKKDFIDDNLDKTIDCLDYYKDVLETSEWNKVDGKEIKIELEETINQIKSNIKKIKEIINSTIEFQKNTISSIENDSESNKVNQDNLDELEDDIKNVYNDLLDQIDNTSTNTWDLWT